MKEVIEEIYRKDKFGNPFDIGVVYECEYDDKSSSNEKESSDEEHNEI